ncbi:MAG: helix-turn-helix transcriptional regulator [Clostridia bacterium]|nr:helix-turn-helix transcriptional regulator [Clostridia bacterium]
MSFNELKQHGSPDFPFELYELDENHPKYEMASHWHTSLELIRVISGKLTVNLNERQYEGKENSVFFANCETIHRAKPENCVYECLVFSLDFLKTQNSFCREFINGLIGGHLAIIEKPDDQEIVSLTNGLFEAMKEKGDGSKFKVIGTANLLLAAIADKKIYSSDLSAGGMKENKNYTKLKRSLEFIRSNYDCEISLDDMAGSAGLSRKYFFSFFKQMTGKTPFDYLTSYRIEKACKRLIGSDMSVTQIAYSCGFNDLSYFIKTFKSIKNATPSEYAKLSNKKQEK